MTELIWDGKYDKDGRKVAPLRVPLPFQTVETINEAAQERQRMLDLFSTGRDPEWRLQRKQEGSRICREADGRPDRGAHALALLLRTRGGDREQREREACLDECSPHTHLPDSDDGPEPTRFGGPDQSYAAPRMSPLVGTPV